MKNIILIAAPAAGKGTEADLLSKEFNMVHISTGDMLREEIKKNSDLGNYIKSQIDNGLFVSDELIIEMLKKRIQEEDCKTGYILDGFPRNVEQARAYQKILEELNKDVGLVIIIDIDKNIAASRIEGRISCPNCKQIYNTSTPLMMPKVDGICDNCGSKLIKRPDDRKEVYIERYNTYIKETQPLIEFYEGEGIAYHIDGSHSPLDTHNQVVEVLRKNND